MIAILVTKKRWTHGPVHDKSIYIGTGLVLLVWYINLYALQYASLTTARVKKINGILKKINVIEFFVRHHRPFLMEWDTHRDVIGLQTGRDVVGLFCAFSLSKPSLIYHWQYPQRTIFCFKKNTSKSRCILSVSCAWYQYML